MKSPRKVGQVAATQNQEGVQSYIDAEDLSCASKLENALDETKQEEDSK